MEKILVLVLFILYSLISFAQTNFVSFTYTSNQDVYKPYSRELESYLEDKHITSNTWNMSLSYCILLGDRVSWSSGVLFRKINQRYYDRIKQYNFIYTFGGQQQNTDTAYYTLKDPADLVSKSISLGVLNRVEYQIYKSSYLNGFVGVDLEVYPFDKYKSWYETSDNIGLASYGLSLRKWLLSNINTSVFYRQSFHWSDYFTFSGRISVGTNVYSDWDQYKRYVWIGLGLEVGFGKKKCTK